jgi:amino acid transporter
MPAWLGTVHPRYATPSAALIVQGIVSALLVLVNFFGWWVWDKIMGVLGLLPRLYLSPAGAGEVFQRLLSLAVVLQLVPFVYVFGALVKFAVTETAPRGRYGRISMLLAGMSGLLTTILGIALVFFPTQQITSLWSYEIWMVGGTLAFIGLAVFFFFVYGRLKEPQPAAV